ncbi:MAG: aldo/keto reductase family protein [Acidimicrobiales bacterium]
MRYRRLGNSELSVPEISFGSWLTLGAGVDAGSGEACVRRALDLGINFIDTANVYGGGQAEAFLGRALAEVDRSSYNLATKAFFPMPDGSQGLSAAQIRLQAEASLRRLGTDYVDLWQCHRYDSGTPLEETMGALGELVASGKARYIGFSEWTPMQIQAAVDLVAGSATDSVTGSGGSPGGGSGGGLGGMAGFVSSQPEYSILWRKPEAEVFGLCSANGIGQIVWSPLAQGALTGKYRPGAAPPAGSRAASSSMGAMMGRWRSPEVLTAVEELKPLAAAAGLTMAQMALAWVLRRPEVTSAIVGASRPEQLDDNAAASGVILDPDLIVAIDAIVDPVREA